TCCCPSPSAWSAASATPCAWSSPATRPARRCPAPASCSTRWCWCPRYSSMEMFIAGDAGAVGRREAFERYRCGQHAWPVGKAPASEVCTSLLTSMSAIIHGGALPCLCDPQGSLSAECQARGGAVPMQDRRDGASLPPLLPGHLWLRAQRMP
ncbi:unnamed protein product, partial [Eretmochelys imbricata]